MFLYTDFITWIYRKRFSCQGSLSVYRQTSNISRTSVGKKIVDHSDVVGASPVGAAPTTSSFQTEQLVSMEWAKTTARRDEKHLSFGVWCPYIRGLTVVFFPVFRFYQIIFLSFWNMHAVLKGRLNIKKSYARIQISIWTTTIKYNHDFKSSLR